MGRLSDPFRQKFKGFDSALVGEGELAGKEHGGRGVVLAAVFPVSHQRESPGGKLHPDLMAAPGVQTDAHKAGVGSCETGVLQPSFFDPFSFLFHHKNLVFAAILKEKIPPISTFRGRSVNQGHIFLHHCALLNRLGKSGRCRLRPGVDHDASHILIQPMHRKKFTAQLLGQRGRDIMLRVLSHSFDAQGDLVICIENFHCATLLFLHYTKKIQNVQENERRPCIMWKNCV